MESDSINDIPKYVKEEIIAFNRIMSNRKNDMLEKLNRTHKGEFFVLRFLSKHDKTVLLSELSMALNSSTARISALLGSLEKKGNIERDIDKTNRRNILVTITESGRERVDAEVKQREENLAMVFIKMGKKDTEDFLRLAEKFFILIEDQAN